MRPANWLATAAVLALVACAPAPDEPLPSTEPDPAPETETLPRMADGHPDLRGIWQTMNSAVWNLEDHSAELGVPAGESVVAEGTIPYLDAALAQRQRNYENRSTDDPEASCYMVGVPRITYMPYPFQIMQTPDQVTMLYEYVHVFRNVRLDSEHPPGPIQWWMGDSRGHWDGDTLVVDVIHFTDRTWLDRSGNYHSSNLHVVERYTPMGPDHIWYEATLEDPEVYSQPWTIAMPLYRRKEANTQILEYECYAYTEALKDAEQ
jgi:hypothetical protein